MREVMETVSTIRTQLFPTSEIRLILGDMRELGDLTEPEHRQLASEVSQVADRVYLLGQWMRQYLADELVKMHFDEKKLFIATRLQTLSQALEEQLQQHTTPLPLLVFKGSQNTIFLEEAVKHFLLDKADEKLLTRQSYFWKQKKMSTRN
jgi:UDP-N-acetylmuramyl pentapeptide synthase